MRFSRKRTFQQNFSSKQVFSTRFPSRKKNIGKLSFAYLKIFTDTPNSFRLTDRFDFATEEIDQILLFLAPNKVFDQKKLK